LAVSAIFKTKSDRAPLAVGHLGQDDFVAMGWDCNFIVANGRVGDDAVGGL